MEKFVTRAYNRLEKNKNKGTITKYSSDEKLKRESKYLSSIPGELGIYFPRIIRNGFQNISNEYFLEMEYYPYLNLSDLLFFKKEFGFVCNSSEIAKQLYNILQEFSKYVPKDKLEKYDLNQMYIQKTEREQKNLVQKNRAEDFDFFFSRFSRFDEVIINGQTYENFHIIWPKIKKDLEDWLIIPSAGSFIHGDLCFSNILCKCNDIGLEPIIKLIDPRGEFGKYTVYGDIYYDLAKLYHSTNTGYELIINDKFEIAPNIQTINEDWCRRIDFKFDENLVVLKKEVHENFKKHLYSFYNETRIKFYEAFIYISMAERHYDSLDRQKVMYGSGIKLLNEAYTEWKELPEDNFH